VAIVLNACNRFLLSVPPDLVEISQQLIHERLRDSAGTAVSEIVCHPEGFFRDPVFLLTLEILEGSCGLGCSGVAFL